ncbi:MFS transporter [Sinomicrobium soli]|uniref:MFS transporter n=1 Tax=Sinomicrobium sp. N-1-3-6 TaxID=2219864 RepID=UPI000DCC33AE|nr:MFS transporter [Sinomicrobium sp. N-1-3-6]RAV28670.1 MFS transporter [Sinomicrobium sp. N-1-3-6]
MKRYNKKNERISTISTFLLIPLSGLVTDIYLPSFPEMQQALGVEAGAIQLTLTYFLVSYGFALLFAGSVVDSFGRYNLTLGALVIFALSNFAIVWFPDIYLLYAMRIIQGIATALIVVSKRSFLVDIYSGDKLKHYTSWLTVIWSMAPISAPFIGGYLQKLFGWDANFYLLGIYALVMLVMEAAFSGEALKNFKAFNKNTIAEAYRNVLRAPDFSIGLVVLGLAYGMAMVFAMSTPFIVEHHFHLSPVVTGYCALFSGLGLMFGGLIGRALSHWPFVGKLFGGGTAILVLGILMYSFGQYYSTVYTLMLFVLLLHTSSGFIYTVYFTYCITRFPQYAGVANGLTSGASYLVTSVVSFAIISTIHIETQSLLALSYIILGITMLLVINYLRVVAGKKLLWR